MDIPIYICTISCKFLITKCSPMYHRKSEEVLFNLETDGEFFLSLFSFSRGSQGSGLVFHAKVAFLLFFQLKGLPRFSKRKGACGGGEGRKMREWVGRCKIGRPTRPTVRSCLYDMISRSLPLLYCYGYILIERPTLHEYAVAQWQNNALLPGKS